MKHIFHQIQTLKNLLKSLKNILKLGLDLNVDEISEQIFKCLSVQVLNNFCLTSSRYVVLVYIVTIYSHNSKAF